MEDDHLRDPLLSKQAKKKRAQLASKLFEALGERNYARQKSIAAREEEEAEKPSVLARLWSPFQSFFVRLKLELQNSKLPLQAGLAAGVCSIICFVPGPLSFLNKNGMWAVVTADLVLEPNVGLTFSKGINRTIGTLAAALAALAINYVAPLTGRFEPWVFGFFTFLGAFVATMFKFRRPFKDRWNYAVAMSMITFHILILSQSGYSDKLKLPLIRLVDIVIGFLIASLINLAVVPQFAAETINELVAKNFERAGNVMERCVFEYCDGTVLQQVPEIIAGRSEDDDIHLAFHEIVSSDSEVDKLMKAVPFEPCHGKFFFGYPWHMYDDIKVNLRYTLYDVVALDSCLRAEIQAPQRLRNMFESEFHCIGQECAEIFRLIGSSIRDMKHVKFGQNMRRAEEGTLLLQHKIAKFTSSILMGNTPDDAQLDHNEMEDIGEHTALAEEKNLLYASPHALVDDSNRSSRHASGRSTDSGESPTPKSKKSMLEGHEAFLQRRDSMSQHWDETVERISALSLIKFCSLLIELVAKAKYVVTIVDELEILARFDEEDLPPHLRQGYSQVV